jgi:Tfp pilus assembly protein PilO
MSAQLRNPKILAGTVLGAVVVIVAIAWIAVVGPEKSKADKLTNQIASVKTQLDQRKAALARPGVNVHVRASDIYRLTRAMPDTTDMAGIIFVLNQLANGHKLQFESLQPGPQVAQPGYDVQPITVIIQGRFGDVSNFLGQLRQLVSVKRRALAATGRLFSVDSIDFAQPDNQKEFPNVKATLVVDAFTFAGGNLVPTTPSTSTPSAASGTVAAGANP